MGRARRGSFALAFILAGGAVALTSIASPDTALSLSRSVDATVMTAVAIAEFFAACLAGRRFLRTASRSDLGLAVGLAILAIARHAVRRGHAHHIDIRLGHDEGRLLVAVSDDGAGFEPGAALDTGSGLGLRTICERAQLIGGGVSLVSTPGSGTRVEIALP